jgi:hypothetical protein
MAPRKTIVSQVKIIIVSTVALSDVEDLPKYVSS